MKIQVLKENLAKTIQLAAKFASTKAQVPILGYLSIEATEQGIFVSATNLDVGVRLRLAGKIEHPGIVVVPAKIMGELTQSLPLGSVDLTSTEQELIVSANRVKAKLQTARAEEYPPFPEVSTVLDSLPVDQFLKDYERVGFCVSTDEARPILTGFLWHIKKGQIVATDGYRLSLISNGSDLSLGKESVETLVVPGKAMVQLLQVFKELKMATVNMGYLEHGRQLVVSSEEGIGVVRVLSGDFPKYEGILPKDTSVGFLASREQLLSAVRSAAIFARDSANIVKLAIHKDKVEVSANAAQVGENVVEVEVEPTHEGEGTIAFNGKYLTDFLTHVESDRIGFGMTDALKAGLFYEEGVDGFKHVIMPVRVRS